MADSSEVVEDVCVSDLIDTTEMYLRTIYELEEEGVVPRSRRPPHAWNETVCSRCLEIATSSSRHLVGRRLHV